MSQIPVLLAEIAPEEITPGDVAAGLMVMSAIGGSIMMIGIWLLRVRAGRDIFPAAARKPLCVPLPLLVGGILLAVTMAVMVAGATGSAEAAGENAGPAAAEQNEDAAIPAESPDDGAVPQEQDSPPPNAKVVRMMLDTFSMNLMMLSVFGLVIWLSQQTRSRKLTDPDDLTYADPTDQLFTETGPPDFAAAESPAAQTAVDDLPTSPPNPFIAPTQVEPHRDVESWHLPTEFRFAAETVLVAYLPTAMLRILILSLSPDLPSHPFLEMMDQGIDWSMLVLIGIMAVIVAPVVEELLYRVTILGGFMQQNATLAGWIMSSVLFGFAHGFPDSIALLPLAFAIGYAFIRRRSYRTVILIHCLFNTFNMVIAGASLV